MEPIPMVRLRTGGDPVPLSVVIGVTEALKDLLDDNPMLFMELVRYARDPRHELSAHDLEVLAATYLVGPDRRFVTGAHQVILAATEGEGPQIRLTDPRHPDDIPGEASG